MPGWGGSTIFGLLSAALWGGGDFSGSIAVKRMGGQVRGALKVVVVGHSVSLLSLSLLACALHDHFSFAAPLVWAACGGAVSGIALVAFYLALNDGHMGSAAAVSGLICAALPAAVSAFTEGSPGGVHLLGFTLAGAAIWMIASAGGGASRKAMVLSVLGGVGFGLYFIALKQGGTMGLLVPTAAARVGSLVACGSLLCILLLRSRGLSQKDTSSGLNRVALAWIIGGTVLDTCGNLAFVAATRIGRLDVAAVLASIYPGGTILLAAWLLHERTSRQQKLGMWLAVPAIVLITL